MHTTLIGEGYIIYSVKVVINQTEDKCMEENQTEHIIGLNQSRLQDVKA